ncbi:winged helix-turn-helix transcriptional regulator [Bengtsoniella intestinalis]|uniref:winged helix-turn-helix transcriptional regulator n=1 Tax=Bengtsoniella intestinalis TaxID=3073143 RepID=UPI00391FC3E5
MSDFIINRPDGDAMERLLQAHVYDPVGKILRLALWAGLMRKELVSLQWVDIHGDYINVDQRQIPLSPQLADYLNSATGKQYPYVVTSSRNHAPLSAQGASHMVRQVLDDAGQSAVRLADLRSEYIINALQSTPWEAVCQASGMGYAALRKNFAPYLNISLAAQPKEVTTLDPVQIQTILDQHTDTAITLAMAFAWHMGITLQQMLPLTWRAVDLDAKTLTIEVEAIPLAPWVAAYLNSMPVQNPDARIFVGPKSGNPLLPERISRLVRQVMLKNGINHVTLRDLVADYHQRQNGGSAILSHLQAHEKATTAQLSQALGLDNTVVYKHLKRLLQQKQVVQVGALYYLPSAVVPPEEHQAVLTAYLTQYERLYRKDVVELLGITPNQASILLQKWVKAGWLTQEKQCYQLA